MRYLPTAGLKENMVLGQDVFDCDGRMLLAKHQILNEEYIKNLEMKGTQGVYIDDEFSMDIRIDEIIRPEMRSQALRTIHALFSNDEDKEAAEEWQIRKLVMDVVENVFSNGDVMYNAMHLKMYNHYTYFHSVEVAVLSAFLGARYGMDEHELRMQTAAAFLHDVGRRFLDDEFLTAKRSLTDEERHIVMQHPKLGYEFLRQNFDFPEEVLCGVLEHHEYYNGEGYPLRKSGEEISIFARIIKLADVYDAMISKRPYREALSPSDALEYIMSMRGNEFDPQLVDLFVRWVAVYPVGCEVVLSDERHAIVMKNFPSFAMRPMVRLLDTGETLNLNDDHDARNITIVRTII